MKSAHPIHSLPIKQPKKKRFKHHIVKISSITLIFVIIFGAIIVSLPFILSITIKQEYIRTLPDQFPVTVDPKNKRILENSTTEAYLINETPRLEVTKNSRNIFLILLQTVSMNIVNMPWYQNIAGVGGSQFVTKFVTISPGFRKEQVADAFGKALGWNTGQKKEFITPTEGSFFPGIYTVNNNTTSSEVQALIQKRFSNAVLSHYGTSTSAIVPLHQALTIASLIQRETIGTKDMRLISGIIWNRLFVNMNLQVDATLQYAEANSKPNGSWWPSVEPQDKFIKSPYNTYMNTGLPPTPIANPSIAAILAALNPIKTSCLYYFNDQSGTFHCSDTYKEHKKLIKHYYSNN